jgi:N-acyl homoserine lactone hydrolase
MARVTPAGPALLRLAQYAVLILNDRRSSRAHDVFGDGSVTIIATPGHQSLLVKLPKTGALLLSGDAVHFKDNWDNRRVPETNSNKEQSSASMQRMADIMTKENAQLWINHDKVQRDGQKPSPDFYE